MFKKDSEKTVTVESMYTVVDWANSEDDVLARVHTRTINSGPPALSLEIHTKGRNGKPQVRLTDVTRETLEDLRDMFAAVCEDLGKS
jgi:hypothetical protein|tara:strand:+ start:205 stop:465 length:261 start_codon:yes stop_codon:yes gene_type:complete